MRRVIVGMVLLMLCLGPPWRRLPTSPGMAAIASYP